MAEKNSTLVLKVDLECSKCYNKVRKTLCKFHQDIISQAYDYKKNTVTISGPFNPIKFSKKLKLEANEAIESIDIKADEKKEETGKPHQPTKSEPVMGIKVIEPAAPFLAYSLPQQYLVYPRPCYDGVYGGVSYYEPYGGSRGYGQGFVYYRDENPSCNIM